MALRSRHSDRITHVCIVGWQPVVVGLAYTIQIRRRVTQFVHPHDDRVCSLRKAVFPANSFCKYTYTVADALDVVLGGIPRKGTKGMEPSFIRNNEFGELLYDELAGPLQLFLEMSQPTSSLRKSAPVSTMYTVTPVPAVLSYTKSVSSLIFCPSGKEMRIISGSGLCELTAPVSRLARRAISS